MTDAKYKDRVWEKIVFCLSIFPCCVLSYFSLVFVMEYNWQIQITRVSWVGQSNSYAPRHLPHLLWNKTSQEMRKLQLKTVELSTRPTKGKSRTRQKLAALRASSSCPSRLKLLADFTLVLLPKWDNWRLHWRGARGWRKARWPAKFLAACPWLWCAPTGPWSPLDARILISPFYAHWWHRIIFRYMIM